MKRKPLSLEGLKRLNPNNLVVPTSIRAAQGSISLPDLQLVIGQTPVNLHAILGEHNLYKSQNLKFALATKLLVEVFPDAVKEASTEKFVELDENDL